MTNDVPDKHREEKVTLNINTALSSFSSATQSSEITLALVMKGGGVKGLAYVGALKELEKYYNFEWFIGTSAGAIAAVLLAAGYTTSELESILFDKDFRDFLDAKPYQWPTNLIFRKGIFPAHTFTAWLDQLLSKKLDTPVRVTLGRLPYRVTVYSSRRGQSALVFDSYDPKTKDIPAAYAVRCSMSIPFIFTPQMDAGLRVFDGGMRNNYPVDVLLRDHPDTNFVGLYLGPEHFQGEIGEKGLISDLLSIWTESTDMEALDKYNKQTVIIDPKPISTIDFNLTDEEKHFLLKAGRAATLKFLSKQSLPNKPSKKFIDEAYQEVTVVREKIVSRRFKRKIFRWVGGIIGSIVLIVLLIGCLRHFTQWRTKIDTNGNIANSNSRVTGDSPNTDEITPVDFDDEFLNLNKWTPPPAGWTIDPNEGQGRLVIEKQPQVGCATDIVYGDFKMSFNLKLLNNGGAAWALRADKSGGNYYLFYLSGPTGKYPNRFLTYVVRDGVIDLKSERSNEIDELKEGEQYQIDIKTEGNKISHTITPVETGAMTNLHEFVDPNNSFPRGGICFKTVGDEKFSIDDLFAHPLGTQTPQ